LHVYSEAAGTPGPVSVGWLAGRWLFSLLLWVWLSSGTFSGKMLMHQPIKHSPIFEHFTTSDYF